MKKTILLLTMALCAPISAFGETSLHQLSQHMEALASKAQREFVAAQQEKKSFTQSSIDKAKEHLETLKEKTKELQEKTEQMIEELKSR